MSESLETSRKRVMELFGDDEKASLDAAMAIVGRYQDMDFNVIDVPPATLQADCLRLSGLYFNVSVMAKNLSKAAREAKAALKVYEAGLYMTLRRDWPDALGKQTEAALSAAVEHQSAERASEYATLEGQAGIVEAAAQAVLELINSIKHVGNLIAKERPLA